MTLINVEPTDAQKLATAIANAAKRAGILNDDAHSLSGPQILLLLDNLVEATYTAGEQTAQQEPVGILVSMDVSKLDEPEYRIFGRIYEVMRDGEDEDEVTYLAIEESRNFEAPPQQKPLTLLEIAKLTKNLPDLNNISWVDLVRAVEAAHNIKE